MTSGCHTSAMGFHSPTALLRSGSLTILVLAISVRGMLLDNRASVNEDYYMYGSDDEPRNAKYNNGGHYSNYIYNSLLPGGIEKRESELGSPYHNSIYGPSTQKPADSWTGRWLPERTTKPPDLHDEQHGIKMGIPSGVCDDGKANLTVDWYKSPVNYTCYNPTHKYVPNRNLEPLTECENVPKYYMPQHICMNSPIRYDRPIPTFGDHRPLWPIYGEYTFVPIQRWLHSLEHGGVVALYHPCANPREVKKLKILVQNCLRRHIITPYSMLDPDRPLTLVAWGCRMSMSTVDPEAVRSFIRDRALKGPEKVSADGQYDLMLTTKAAIVPGSNLNDDVLCPE